MNKKENKNEKNEQKRVEEPENAYQTVKIFDSFEEQEEAEIKWLASLSYEEHLKNGSALIKRIFTENLEKYPEIGNELELEK